MDAAVVEGSVVEVTCRQVVSTSIACTASFSPGQQPAGVTSDCAGGLAKAQQRGLAVN